jgi:hypothetical protein
LKLARDPEFQSNNQTTTEQEWVTCVQGHDRDMDLNSFRCFLVERGTRLPVDMDPDFMSIAKAIARGTDIWNLESPVVVQKLRKKFQLKCLAIPSNTHLAERAVKEAKLVSSTGRHEENRSNMAICRSVLLDACDKLQGKEKAKKAIGIIVSQHVRLSQRDDEIETARRHQVLHELTGNHFKKERLRKTEEKIDAQSKNKKKNVDQKKNGVDVADRIAGRVRFGAITKNIYAHAVDAELTQRGISKFLVQDPTKPNQLPREAGIKEKVKRLRINEAARLRKQMKEISSFEPLSGQATFQAVEDAATLG